MDGEGLPNTPNSSEEDFMPENSVLCKTEVSDTIEEDHVEVVDNNKGKQIIIEEVDDFSQNLNGEEKLLLEEKAQNIQRETTEDSTEITDQLSPPNESKINDINFEDKGMPKADMFVCKYCHGVFIDEHNLRNHMFEEHGAKKLGRPRKSREIETKIQEKNWNPDVQKLAKRTDSGKVFACDQCPYTVTRCDSMSKHVLRVHSKGIIKPQFMCEVCGKTFMDRAYLRNHSLSHTQESQYFCEVCGRRFHRQPSLKRHIQSHSEEKQFSCSLCDYQTNRKHLMSKHEENHRAGKALGCKHCTEKFFTQILLRKHCYANHPTRYACSFCKIGFSSRERMWSHMQKIHFACFVKSFKTEDSKEVKVEYIEVKLEPTS